MILDTEVVTFAMAQLAVHLHGFIRVGFTFLFLRNSIKDIVVAEKGSAGVDRDDLQIVGIIILHPPETSEENLGFGVLVNGDELHATMSVRTASEQGVLDEEQRPKAIQTGNFDDWGGDKVHENRHVTFVQCHFGKVTAKTTSVVVHPLHAGAVLGDLVVLKHEFRNGNGDFHYDEFSLVLLVAEEFMTVPEVVVVLDAPVDFDKLFLEHTIEARGRFAVDHWNDGAEHGTGTRGRAETTFSDVGTLCNVEFR